MPSYIPSKYTCRDPNDQVNIVFCMPEMGRFDVFLWARGVTWIIVLNEIVIEQMPVSSVIDCDILDQPL